MATEITFRRGSNDPTSGSGITLAEPVFNTNLHTFHIGLGYGITAEWVGAPISGLSADIAAGITYKIPTLAAVKNYVTGTSITNYVSSFNGLTGAVTGVTVGGTNVFTGLNSFNAGICASGITLSSGIINAPSAGLYLTSSNTKNAKVNLLSGPSSSQVELDAITVRVRNTTDGALPTFELYEATDVYSAKMQYTSSATNDATITFPAITGTVALTNQVVTSVNGQTGAVTVSGGTNVVTSFNGATGAIQGVSSVNGQTGAVTIASVSNVVSSFNGLTGAVTGVASIGGFTGTVTVSDGTYTTARKSGNDILINNVGVHTLSITSGSGINAITASGTTGAISYSIVNTGVTGIQAGTGISVSSATGNPTITNTGVQSFNGNTGAVTGASLGANTFTGLQTMTSGISAAGGMTLAGTLNTTGDIKFNGTTAKSITTTQAPLTIKGATSSVVSVAGYNAVVLGVQTTDPLKLWSASGVVDINSDKTTAFSTSIKLNTNDGNFEPLTASVTIQPSTYFTADRTLNIQDASGTIALTSQLMGAINGSTAATTAVTSFNGLTGAVGGVCAAQANTFTALQTFTTGISAAGGITFNGPVTGATATFTRLLTASGGISASGGMTLDGGKVWTSANDGPTSGLDAGSLYGVSASFYASSLSTGLGYGGIVSINAGNSAAFDITAGSGYIVTTGASFTANPNPTITTVTWTAKTGVTLSGLTAQDTTWIYIDGSGNLQQQSTFFTDTQVQSTLAIGALVHPSRAYISLAKTIPNVSYATDKQYEQFIRAFGPLKVSGHTVQPNGANLKLDRSSGTAFVLGRNYPNDPDNPSVVSDNAQTDCTFWRYYRGATAGSFITVLNQTAIDPDNYDDGDGTLATVPSNKPFSIQRIFYFPGTPSVLGVYYGRLTYASISEAANNIHFEDFTEITNTATNAVFAGFLLVKKGVTNLTTAIAADDARIIQSGQFRSTTSGGGSVSTNLDNLSDVTITSVADDDLLIYDTATSQWLNTPLQHIGVTRVNGLTGAVQAVSSFNGATGAITGVSSVNGQTGAVTIASTTNVVTSFNGLTGAVQGVSAAVAGTGISVSGATGAVTITNTGVQTFNGLTGAVTGVTVGGANTFTALNTFNGGISAAGGTFSALTQFTSGLSGHINISSSNATGNMYLLMARGAGVTAVFMDNTTTPLVYQPSAGNLGLKGITLVNGNDYLYITPTQITATNTVTPSSAYFYFIAEGGNYLQSPNLSQMGDISYQNSSMVLTVDPSQRFMAFADANLGTTFGFFGVNRNIVGDYAVDISSATGKGLQLTYNSINGAGVTRANFDVSSTGNLTIIPSGGLATVTGTLNVSAGVCASTLVVAGGSTFGAAVDHVFGLYNRGLKINAGKGSSEILSYGNETLSVSAMGGNGTLELFGSSVTLGDDGNNNSTNIITDDSTQTITYSAPSVGHIFYGPITSTNDITAPNIVNSFNGLTGAVTGVSRVNGLSGGITLAAGTGITFTTSGNTITLAATASGGSTNSTTQTLDFSENTNGLEIVFSGTGGDFGASLRDVELNKTIIATINAGGADYSFVLDSIESFYDATNGWSARLVAKAPFTDTGSSTVNTAEAIYGDAVSRIDLDLTSASGLNIVDFWTTINSYNLYHQEETYVTKTVTGQTWVTADSYIECKVLGLTTADHTPEDAILEGVKFEINNIVAGTGFDIIGHAPEGTYGKYTVKCLGQ